MSAGEKPEKPPTSEMLMRRFFRARPFDIGFKNGPTANANPGLFPCPLVAGPMSSYWDSLMCGVITPKEMDVVTREFEKKMASVPRKDNTEPLRANILESLWLKPYAKARDEARARRDREKKRVEQRKHKKLVEEREALRKQHAEAFQKKLRKRWLLKAREARATNVVDAADCPLFRRQHRGVYKLGCDGEKRYTYESLVVQVVDEEHKESEGKEWERLEELQVQQALKKRALGGDAASPPKRRRKVVKEESEAEGEQAEGEQGEGEQAEELEEGEVADPLPAARRRAANASWRTARAAPSE